jgi:hypothetical protein
METKETSTELMILEMQIRFAQKIARRYEGQNAIDDPHYDETLKAIGDLQRLRDKIVSQLQEA